LTVALKPFHPRGVCLDAQLYYTLFKGIECSQARALCAADNRALDRIRLALELLSDWPQMGRPSEIPDARVWPVRRTPYLVYYEPATDGIYVLHVRDARRFEDDAGA